MKGVKKCTKLSAILFLPGFLLVLSFILSLVKVQNVSALDISSTYTSYLGSANVRFWYQNGYTTVPMRAVYHSDNLRFYRYNGTTTLDTTIREINFTTHGSPQSPSIAHFAVRISKFGNSIPLGFEGFSSQANSILARNCINVQDTDTTDGSMVSFWQCDYWVYTNGYGYFQLLGDVFYNSGSEFYLDVLGQVDYAVLSAPLNASTITNVGNQITQAIENLEDTMEAAGSGPTPAQIESAAKSAIEAAREDEKEEYEEQQEDVSDGADDAGEEADAATSSLIDTGRDIIETIRDTPATNCVIRIKRGNFDTGNINLCDVPQQIRTMISTAIVIPVTLAALHIAYSVVMLYLNTVRKEQE